MVINIINISSKYKLAFDIIDNHLLDLPDVNTLLSIYYKLTPFKYKYYYM